VPAEPFGDPDAASSAGSLGTFEQRHDVSRTWASPKVRRREEGIRDEDSGGEGVASRVLKVGDIRTLGADGDRQFDVILLKMVAQFMQAGKGLPPGTQRPGDGQCGRVRGVDIPACNRTPCISLRIRNRPDLNVWPAAKFRQCVALQTVTRARPVTVKNLQHPFRLGDGLATEHVHPRHPPSRAL
jgi:hypothetical protein